MTILKEHWNSLIKPNSISVKDIFNSNFSKSEIVIEPLARGFGNTIGSALRRILLSSISGFAPTSFKMEGVLHEYSSISGVKEDVLDIIMNLKNLAVRRNISESFSLRVFSDKPGPVFAGSIVLPAGIEILNKSLLICTLDKGGKIDAQINFDYNKGYCTAENFKKETDPVGTIALDAIFNPVKQVSYTVKNTRVGQITDFDKLVMEIETNSTITPRDALGIAAKILQDQLQILAGFEDIAEEEVFGKDLAISDLEFNKNLLKTIEELELSVRSYNCLKNENITYVGDLVGKTEAEMLRTANFGRKSLNELRDNLRSMGLSFGMKLQNWPPRNLEELLKVKNKEF